MRPALTNLRKPSCQGNRMTAPARAAADRTFAEDGEGKLENDGAAAFGDAVSVGLQMRHSFPARLKLHQTPGKLQRTERGDIGNRETRARNEWAMSEFAVQPSCDHTHLVSLRKSKILELWLFERRQAGVSVANPVHDSAKEIPFDSTVGHFDESPLVVIDAEEIRLRPQPFKIGANGPGLAEHPAVIEFENGHLRQRAFGEERFIVVFPTTEIDRFQRNVRQALFRHEHQHAARIRGSW